MKKWILTCSIDGVNIDYETIIKSEREPNYWTCSDIAQENGCELWSLAPYEEEVKQ